MVSVLRSRPAMRWLAPSAAAAVVIGGGVAVGAVVAGADPKLPPRSAAQLLVDVQNARLDGFSGTVVQTADLGLPAVSVAGADTASSADVVKLLTGSNTARVWYSGQDRVRVALTTKLGETDLVRNGTDLWLWRSTDNSATHVTTSADDRGAPSGLPVTPQEAADRALAAIDPTTVVTTGDAGQVAGRNAYQLRLTPRDSGSLVGRVQIAVDSTRYLPLAVEVYAKGATAPAFRVAFQQISFTRPDAQQFQFNPPAGAKITTEKRGQAPGDRAGKPGAPGHPAPGHRAPGHRAPGKAPAGAGAEPTVVGTGWTSVVVTKVPTGGTAPAQLTAVLNQLPRVSGAWGAGRLLSGSLFSVLLTDDGRLLAGAVPPERLYAAAAH
jgi:outer membrane lipoprotein-sorting protein